jgi:hypothetical protein
LQFFSSIVTAPPSLAFPGRKANREGRPKMEAVHCG